jgi:hypothetical protein
MTNKTNTQNDQITVAIQIVIEEIATFRKEIAKNGSKAFESGNIADVKLLASVTERLNRFSEKTEQLLDEWIDGFTEEEKKKIPTAKEVKYINGTPRVNSRPIKVIFENGKVVFHKYAADTLAATIEMIGIDKVKGLDLYRSGLPLIGSQKSDKYSQRKVGAYYIFTNLSNEDKKSLIKEIASKLQLNISVEY